MRALLSVAKRDGIGDLARELLGLGIEIFATDGTREALAAEGIEVAPVTALTNVPHLVGGQVKTFHPAVYAGILARRDRPDQLAELADQDIGLLDIVVVNVRPFAPQVGARVVPIDEAIEMIDVGGVALLSAAARNFAGVAAVCDPSHYPRLVAELREHGLVTPEFRQQLASDAFAMVAAYNAEVAGYLNHISNARFPDRLTMSLEKLTDLRYGENPQQQAAFYRETTHRSGSLADSTQLQGEPPTFNDLLDMDAAFRIATDFTKPTVTIVKRTNPVGLASGDSIYEAFQRAYECDPATAFGATIGLNAELDEATAEAIVVGAYEAVVAPGVSDAARALLTTRPDLLVLTVPPSPTDGLVDYGIARLDFKRISGGLLVETLDTSEVDRAQLQVVTQRRPNLEELTDMLFAWRAVRHVSSNAVVLVRNMAIVGVGAGQASRLVATEIALHRAADRAKLSCLASDAYFPFADAIQLAAERGVTAIIQPGGSRRDSMAIEVADRHHMAMVFTGRRHFRH
ncbi:MAG TPA: bifunctional phosphoribosylaminoimidazolecarboxamide formyltransferase/IMP cyclohydrolase [Candidatus Limnocylindrales bacterium]|nr:bifunctional phosphoribosylaminoimidazolecarboxamide formyltransferase/IMP cyclohydrolase [Candidatus Limnocylindrales bacterium]